MSIVTMSSKGQIIIPKELRDKLSIEKGANFSVFGREDLLIFKRIEKADETMIEKKACALLSEEAFAKEWDTPEEDAAWKDL